MSAAGGAAKPRHHRSGGNGYAETPQPPGCRPAVATETSHPVTRSAPR